MYINKLRRVGPIFQDRAFEGRPRDDRSPRRRFTQLVDMFIISISIIISSSNNNHDNNNSLVVIVACLVIVIT